MPPPLSPAPLFDLATAYWRSAALFTALDLDLFAKLGAESRTLDALVSELGCPRRSLEMLVEALTALKLLNTAADGSISNSALTRTYLVPGTPAYLGEAIRFNARSYGAWGQLTAAVQRATPTQQHDHILGADPAATRNFVLAMHGRAQGVARCLVGLLDLSGRQRLLDIGGGPATYSALLAERFPHLSCTVMDLPGVLAVAAELVANSPARDRLTLRPGNAFTDEFGSGYDVVLISGVLHRTEGEGTLALLRKAAAALVPGGLLAVSDLFTGGNHPGPVLPELFSLHMLLTATAGRSLPLPAMAETFAAAGLELQQTLPYPAPLPHTLLLGKKL